MPQKILKTYFGYDEFRPGQKEIVDSIISGNDALVLMPTGGGKSICFQVPSLVFEGTTIVISPLISLMKDQVDTLVRKKIAATYLNSSLAPDELKKRFTFFTEGKYALVYVSPERLQNKQFIGLCQKVKIPFLVVDEAHCISQWGHDFRPEYTQIHTFLAQLKVRPVVAAFTASATKHVQQEICSQLQLKTPQVFAQSFRRVNLQWFSKFCSSRFEQEILLLRLLKHHQGQSGIIYATTHEKCETITKFLSAQGIICEYYHGGVEGKLRAEVQERFLTDATPLIVATNAFGMGVDKPNVRFVIHLNLPANLEGYYQEAGRAGRDGQVAFCYLLTTEKDITTQVQLQARRYPPPEIVSLVKEEIKRISPNAKPVPVQKAYVKFFKTLNKKLFFYSLYKLEELECVKIEKFLIIFHNFHNEKLFLAYKKLYVLEQRRRKRMIAYVKESICRTRQILEYFDEKFTEKNCGQCDVCLRTTLKPHSDEMQFARSIKPYESHLPYINRRTVQYLAILSHFHTSTETNIPSIPGVGKGLTYKMRELKLTG
jgi:RecQ family ATP-dependent DNA helicase